ncbi:MAG: hypothetical protein J6Q63_03840 [Bacteroidales bacterium]|nr:hypothetical protein [Bacteroidales bacterium]
MLFTILYLGACCYINYRLAEKINRDPKIAGMIGLILGLFGVGIYLFLAYQDGKLSEIIPTNRNLASAKDEKETLVEEKVTQQADEMKSQVSAMEVKDDEEFDEEFDECDDECDDEEAEDPIGECVYDNVSYDIFTDSAFAQYLIEDGASEKLVIPDTVTFEGKEYPVTYWGAGDDCVKIVELGKNVKFVDPLHADCTSLEKLIIHSPKGFIEWENEDGDPVASAEDCFPGVEVEYV